MQPRSQRTFRPTLHWAPPANTITLDELLLLSPKRPIQSLAAKSIFQVSIHASSPQPRRLLISHLKTYLTTTALLDHSSKLIQPCARLPLASAPLPRKVPAAARANRPPAPPAESNSPTPASPSSAGRRVGALSSSVMQRTSTSRSSV